MSFGPLLRAYNSLGSEVMNLKFSVPNNLTKDFQETGIWRNLVFTWPPYWVSKIEKNTIFSDFHHILALKYQPNCQNILNIYGLYKNTTIMEQTKPNILIICLKTAALPHIEAYLDISKIEKAAIFEWVKI